MSGGRVTDERLAELIAKGPIIPFGVGDTISALRELQSLRDFVRGLFDLNDWPDGGDIDGFDMQELMTKHGILVEQRMEQPCNVGREDFQNCSCAEYGDFPQTCYRKVAWALRAAGEQP